MTPAQILVKAREIIADPQRWTKGTLARVNGRVAETERRCFDVATSPDACFCALGACVAAVAQLDPAVELADVEEIVDAAVLQLAKSLVSNNARTSLFVSSYARDLVVEFNDKWDRAHAEVLDLFDRALAGTQ